MKFNEKITEVLKEFNINKDEALLFLLSVYHNLSVPFLFDSLLKTKIESTGIVSYNHKTKSYDWNVGLFENQETSFAWVGLEYIPLFMEKNKSRGKNLSACISRMKKFFAENPDIRKEEVIGAVKMYLRQVKSEYMISPHYFIEKDKGVNKTVPLLDWVNNYRLVQSSSVGRSHSSNTMQ